MRESISISLPESIKAELDRFSESQGVSRSETVRVALKGYLFIRTFRALRAQMVPAAEHAARNHDVLTSEFILREFQEKLVENCGSRRGWWTQLLSFSDRAWRASFE